MSIHTNKSLFGGVSLGLSEQLSTTKLNQAHYSNDTLLSVLRSTQICVKADQKAWNNKRWRDMWWNWWCMHNIHMYAVMWLELVRYLEELLHLVLVFPAEDWSMSPPPPTELAAPSEVDRCSGNGLGHMLLSPPDPAWPPALGKSSSPEPPSVGPELRHNASHARKERW